MTSNELGDAPPTETPRIPQPSRARTSWMVGASVAVVLIVGYILFEPRRAAKPGSNAQHRPPVQTEAASVLADGQLRVDPNSTLHAKLQVIEVSPERVSFPVLKVTGFVIAQWASDSEGPEGRWNFNTPQLLRQFAQGAQ